MGNQIIQLLCKIGSPQEIRSLLLDLRKFWKSEKRTPESCRMHSNLINHAECGFFNFVKLKYRRGDQIIQPFCRIGCPLLDLRKFWRSEKRIPESCRMHWNLMNDHEFGFLKFVKLKCRRGDQIIQLFCRIASPQEIRSPLVDLRKYWKSEKGTHESCRMHSSLMNNGEYGSFNFVKLKYRRWNQIIQPFCRIASPPRN